MRTHRVDFGDILIAIAILSITAGVALVHIPAALIVFGVLVAIVAWLLAARS